MERQKMLYRAGVIPYIIENDQIFMMFMVPSSEQLGGIVPQIAKGKIEEGEDTLTAGLREAKEELGLFIGNVKFTEEVGQFMGRTTVFISSVKDRDMFGMPGEETSDVAWMTMEQFNEEGRILHRPVVSAAYRKICKIEGIAASHTTDHK